MSQLIQVAGSLLILAAYAAAQRGALNQRSLTYQIMNLVGSAVLAVEADYTSSGDSCSLRVCGQSCLPPACSERCALVPCPSSTGQPSALRISREPTSRSLTEICRTPVLV